IKNEIIDGNTACAKASYKLCEMSFIYPITPSSPMAEAMDEMSTNGTKNIFGNKVDITEMQSEGGVAGALHGSALNGSITTTFTSSQGLLLMLPNMYKIAGEMLPTVINVASRSIASHALNIFCDHSDVMSARSTGFAMLCSSNPQEVYDFTVASFLTSIKTRIPFLNFFDGFRTSHQISNVKTFDDLELKSIFPYQQLAEYKSRAISPNTPKQFGTSEGTDIFFQGRERSNQNYAKLGDALEQTFADIKKLTGKEYHCFEYYGDKNAKFVIVVMASAFDTVKNYIDDNKKSIGAVKVNLYRPFISEQFLDSIPKSVSKIAVLDRTKEQGSIGEPLYLDICETVLQSQRNIKVFGGRFGLGGKEFNPAMVDAVFENLMRLNTKNHFTIGINDDISKTSLDYDKNFVIDSNTFNTLIYGLGSDGMVGASKSKKKIVGKNSKKYVQEYSLYDSKKSGGITRSYLSFGKKQINSPYLTAQNDIAVVSSFSFLNKYNVINNLKQNGTLLVNCPFETAEQLCQYISNDTKQKFALKNIKLYSINATKIASESNLKGKISMIMEMAYFIVSKTLNTEIAKLNIENSIKQNFAKKGEQVVNENLTAIENLDRQIKIINIDEYWKNPFTETKTEIADEHYNNYIAPVQNLLGDSLKVSAVNLFGENACGTSRFEKRNIANKIPYWISQKCLQCGKCSFVCPHAVIRAKLLTDTYRLNAPKTLQCKKSNIQTDNNFVLEISPDDCTGCGICESACPVKAIMLKEKQEVLETERANYKFTNALISNQTSLPTSPLSLQFVKPYFEFSGACAGCGETPYIKLLTQMFGNHLIIANATGCSSIYGASAPTCPYTFDQNGQGTAWATSLFEDNAEFGFGINKSEKTKRQNFKNFIETNINKADKSLIPSLKHYLENFDNFAECEKVYLAIKDKKYSDTLSQNIVRNADLITPKTVWIIGGDGWAYDIDFGGLDHILASGENINILVLDTEVYSNTGGQMSKSTPRNAIAKFCSGGKKASKKNLTLSALNYKNVYVAEVCLGADMMQLTKAFKEAQEYNGVSLVIAYCPCISHGIDMSKNLETEIDAVKSGYVQLFRYNPELLKVGQNPMQIDSDKPTNSFKAHILKERRFANFAEKNTD